MLFSVYLVARPMMSVHTASDNINIGCNIFMKFIFSRTQFLASYYLSHELGYALNRELWIVASS